VASLPQVAEIETTWEPSRIHRRDTIPTMTLYADLKQDYPVSSALGEMIPWLNVQQNTWPPGFRYAIGGEREESAKASKSIWVKLPVAVIVILLLLMAHFNSFRRVAAILLLIPFALIGVSFGLIITQNPLGFVTFLGIIALAGMVINTGVVLLDRIRLETESGATPYNAIVIACKRRLRPILLTTLTTVVGMLPLAYGGGPMFSPMAIAIIFGLIFNTLLSLLILPTLYAIFFKVGAE
jgi:multidrug efflux pump